VRLITAHRILITVGIAFFLFYAAVQLWHSRGVGGAALAHSIGAVVVAVGLAIYYRTLRRL
jgi:hypothetical protein